MTTGLEGIIGGKAQLVSKTEVGTKVLLKGELRDVVSGDDLSVGETVAVIGFERMKLVVHREKKD